MWGSDDAVTEDVKVLLRCNGVAENVTVSLKM